jgi:hypothetical protein
VSREGEGQRPVDAVASRRAASLTERDVSAEPGMRPEIIPRDARRSARTLTALPRLRPAVWPRNSTCRREGNVRRVLGKSRASRRRRARATPAMPSDGPRRHTADRAFFRARRAAIASGNARRARASSARGFHARTHLQGGGGSSESSHLACDGCER